MSDLSSSQKIFSYLAPAKINLCLKIGNKLPNGYHELASIVGFTEFGDAIKIEVSDKDDLTVFGQFSANLNDNIYENTVMKSVKTLRELKKNIIPPLKITIDKQIPVGGGLGGGSSDAATVFLALNDIFKLKISKTDLENIAVKIGADIPACLNRKFVIMRGIGDQITPIIKPNIPQYVVIANPKSISETKHVFQEFDENTFEVKRKDTLKFLTMEQFLNSGNDLEISARKLYPNIENLLIAMKTLYPRNYSQNPTVVQMSGSGSSCFALFDDKSTSKIFCQKIKEAGYWSVSTKFIS